MEDRGVVHASIVLILFDATSVPPGAAPRGFDNPGGRGAPAASNTAEERTMDGPDTLPRALRRFDVESDFDAIMGAVDLDGGAIVERFISADLLARLNAELDAAIAARAPGSENVTPIMGAFWGHQTKRFTRLAAFAPSFAELIDHDLMHRWARRQFPGDYWLNTGQAMIVGPGQPAQYLHRDIAIWPFINQSGLAAPDAMVSIMLALSDFTEEVGATRVIPGSNRWADFEQPGRAEETTGAVMPAGSALLYSGKTMHAAGANTSATQWRRGLHMSFCLGWLTPEEASVVGVPWAIAQRYPPRVQRMLGYASPAQAEGASPTNWLIDFEDVRHHLGAAEDAPV
jgi:hypothetical protein